MIESIWFRSIVFAVGTLIPIRCPAYEVLTHYFLSLGAFSQSLLATQDGISNLGLKPQSVNQLFPTTVGDNDDAFLKAPPPCAHGKPEPVARLIACGAMFEDFPALSLQSRPVNHFFNPLNGSPLTCLGAQIGLLNSPDWALGVNPPSYQQNSYANARDYFENALTTSNSQSVRDESWGKTFQSIGQVIHHLQDMAQPQHVRNDAHADVLGEGSTFPCLHASRFERDTTLDDRLASLAQTAMSSAVTPVYPAYPTVFATPRAFWTGGVAGTGIADYTNANFVSAGTNFCGTGYAPTPNDDFPQPTPTGWQDISIAQAYQDTDGSLARVSSAVDGFCQVAGQTPDVYLQNCYVTMVTSTVHDALPGANDVQNNKASTFSVFDEDLKIYDRGVAGVPGCSQLAYGNTQKIFALNRFNFAATYPFLMSHAVAYSAGLINFFFRGQMKIAAPQEGVYAIFDTSNCFASGSQCKSSPPGTVANVGFTKIKLLLMNTTPNDDMGAGTLRAVAKYHLNTCYNRDLSGEYDVQPGFTDTCRSPEEYITVSNTVDIDPTANGVGKGGNSGVGRSFDTQSREFTFANPIPMNASDLFLQVVFKGTLGQESNAIAVTTKDISEPNFMAIENVTDYAFDPNQLNPNSGQYGQYVADANIGV
jgi:hypothetical protein